MESHVRRAKSITEPKIGRSTIRHSPVCLHVGKARVPGLIERVVDEGPRDAAVFVLGSYGDGTEVQGLVKGSSPSLEGKRQALGDSLARALNHVVVYLIVPQGLEELFGARGVVEKE